MANNESVPVSSLPLSVLRRIDEVCQRFEAAWQAGVPLSLEDCLRDVPAPEGAPLLRELLRLELDYRQRADQPGSLPEFLSRFPGFAPIVRDVWREQTQEGDLPHTLDTAGGGTLQAEGLPPAPLPFPDIPGYKILAELGRGGMGVVYKAREVELGRLVALKLMLAGGHAGPEHQQRSRAEALIVAALKRDDIVKIYKVGEHQGMPYLVLEFCERGSLDKHLRGNPIPALNAARILEKLAKAMEAAHQANIVHRDLKPANVLVTREGKVKISDFGLAKRLDVSGPTLSGDIMGTPSYMSPEQAAGEVGKIDHRTDVYALGVILYEMLTGRPPFKAATIMETLRQVIEADPIPPSEFERRVPRDLETICLTCLAKKPERRYFSAQALANDLRSFIKGLPIRKRPAGKVERLVKWGRRNPALASLAAVAVLAFVLVLGTSLFFTGRLAEKNRLAEIDKQGLREANVESDGLRMKIEEKVNELATKANELDAMVKEKQSLVEKLIAEGKKQEKLIADLKGKQTEIEQKQKEAEQLALTILQTEKRRCASLLTQSLLFWERNDIPEAARILDELPAEARTSWEYRHVWGLLQRRVKPDVKPIQEMFVLRDHRGPIRSLALGANGTRLVVKSTKSAEPSDTRFKVWELDSYEATVVVSTPPPGADVFCVAPSPDGKRIVSGSKDKLVTIWDAKKVWETGNPSESFTFKAHSNRVGCVDFSSDGKWIASASAKTVKVSDSKTGKEVFSFEADTDGPPCVAISPDGKLIRV